VEVCVWRCVCGRARAIGAKCMPRVELKGLKFFGFAKSPCVRHVVDKGLGSALNRC